MTLTRSGIVARPRTIHRRQLLFLQVLGGRGALIFFLQLRLLALMADQEALLDLIATYAAVEVRRQQTRPLAERGRGQAVHGRLVASGEECKVDNVNSDALPEGKIHNYKRLLLRWDCDMLGSPGVLLPLVQLLFSPVAISSLTRSDSFSCCSCRRDSRGNFWTAPATETEEIRSGYGELGRGSRRSHPIPWSWHARRWCPPGRRWESCGSAGPVWGPGTRGAGGAMCGTGCGPPFSDSGWPGSLERASINFLLHGKAGDLQGNPKRNETKLTQDQARHIRVQDNRLHGWTSRLSGASPSTSVARPRFSPFLFLRFRFGLRVNSAIWTPDIALEQGSALTIHSDSDGGFFSRA